MANELYIDYRLHPKQEDAFYTTATELLFGGATEGGKSHLARIALIMWCLEIPGLQCVLIRKKYQDIIANHVKGPSGFDALLWPLILRKKVKVTQDGVFFDHGDRPESVIAFVHCQDERQFTSAQGVEKHVIVVDEATQISERLIKFFRAWCRMPREMKDTLPEHYKGKFPRIIYTANPIGPSVPFFKRNFVKARREGQIEKVAGFLRQYISSRVTDNPSADLEAHHGRLAGLEDAALAKALHEGDWDCPVGEFFPEWDESRHVVADFRPPLHWYRYRVYDWGTADPSYCGWFAISDGEPLKDDLGRQRWFPRGALVLYDEWYICDPKDPAKGLRMRNEDMAAGIIDRSDINSRSCVTLTDSKPFQDDGGDGIAAAFARRGVPLTQGDTSRVAGWSQLRGRLIGVQVDPSMPERIPMLYICERCKYARDYIPALPRHPSETKTEDAAEHGEATHVCDAIRYACMAHNNSVIKDHIQPLQTRIQRELQARKPTINKILRSSGHAGIG